MEITKYAKFFSKVVQNQRETIKKAHFDNIEFTLSNDSISCLVKPVFEVVSISYVC